MPPNITNQITEALAKDSFILGARTITMSPTLFEVYGELGLDFVWLDFEHGGPNPSDSTFLENMVRAADVADVGLIVRVPTDDPPLLRKVFDTGVRNVLVPQVNTEADVREVVKASRFTYEGDPGTRGSSTSRANFWGGDTDEYATREDATTNVGVMIETRQAVENLEEILSVPELGFAYLGPGDLSVSYGHPSQRDHPEVVDAVTEVMNQCRDATVPFGRSVSSPQEVESAVSDGFRILRLGDEIQATYETYSRKLDAIEK